MPQRAPWCSTAYVSNKLSLGWFFLQHSIITRWNWPKIRYTSFIFFVFLINVRVPCCGLMRSARRLYTFGSSSLPWIYSYFQRKHLVGRGFGEGGFVREKNKLKNTMFFFSVLHLRVIPPNREFFFWKYFSIFKTSWVHRTINLNITAMTFVNIRCF